MGYTNRSSWEEAEEAKLEKLADLSGEYEMNSNADYIREAFGETIDSHANEGLDDYEEEYMRDAKMDAWVEDQVKAGFILIEEIWRDDNSLTCQVHTSPTWEVFAITEEGRAYGHKYNGLLNKDQAYKIEEGVGSRANLIDPKHWVRLPHLDDFKM